MTVREIVESGRMRVITSPPFNEKRFVICDRHHAIPLTEPNAAFEPAAIPEEYADRTVRLAYHYEALPAHPEYENCCVLCIE